MNFNQYKRMCSKEFDESFSHIKTYRYNQRDGVFHSKHEFDNTNIQHNFLNNVSVVEYLPDNEIFTCRKSNNNMWVVLGRDSLHSKKYLYCSTLNTYMMEFFKQV